MFLPLDQLSEQHPREQGLKRGTGKFLPAARYAFRATSKRTRIETRGWRHTLESHTGLSEQHPREQGLKPVVLLYGYVLSISFQSNIQENKD